MGPMHTVGHPDSAWSLEEAFHFEIARNSGVPEISGRVRSPGADLKKLLVLHCRSLIG